MPRLVDEKQSGRKAPPTIKGDPTKSDPALLFPDIKKPGALGHRAKRGRRKALFGRSATEGRAGEGLGAEREGIEDHPRVQNGRLKQDAIPQHITHAAWR